MTQRVISLTSPLSLPPFSRQLTSWLPAPEALLEQRPDAVADDWIALGEQVGAPWQHLVTTRYTARACLLGAASGRAFYHHELRRRLPYPQELGPELAVWDDAALVPSWGDGVLVEPKYFSFFQDAPLPAYNPNHRVKWRAHELLHGACAFYWSPQLTRFGCYLATRLNELVPVVHWYGLDEIGRPSCPEHVGVVHGRELCAACEAAQRPFWTHEPAGLAQRAASLHAAAGALEHFQVEYEACLRELERLRPQPTPRGALDASSDAVGYMQSHWARLTSWSFGAWMERFCVAGLDYDETLDAYVDRVGAAFHALISGEVTLDLEQARRLRARRAVQDAAARVLVAQEWLAGRAARAVAARLEPAMAAAEQAARGLLTGTLEVEAGERAVEGLIAAFVAQRAAFPVAVADALPALGHRFSGLDPIAPAMAQLTLGAESAAPAWCERVGAALPERLDSFARSDLFARPEALGARLAAWLEAQGDEEGAAIVGLEAWLRAAPQRDEDAERFGVVPEDVAALSARPARLKLHATLRRARWPRAAVVAVLGEEVPEGPLVVRVSGGEAQVMVEDAQTAALLDAVERGAGREAACDALLELIEQGWVVWVA